MNNTKLLSFNKTLSIAFAYVGIVTGAGLATGREIVQYFVSFGYTGIFGAIAISVLFMLFGKWILSLGSLYQSESHMEVFEDVSHTWIAKILDWSLVFCCFVMSFVMVAGAGSNLQAQFGTPAWVGSLICAALILAVSYMDFDKVTAALGIFTPIILIMLLIGLVTVVTGPDVNWTAMFAQAEALPTTLPNISLSVINYLAMCLMTGTSMLFVLGGQIVGISNAERGGVLGGFFVGVISLITTILIFSKIDVIGNDPIPMLTFMTDINPYLGLVMFIVIFGMIFNTGFSVCYSLGKRIAGEDDNKFKKVMPIIVVVALLLSLFGFTELVAVMYPLLGYIGILLLLTIAIAFYGARKHIAQEKGVRGKLFALLLKRADDNKDFTAKDAKHLDKLAADSYGDDNSIVEELEEVVENLDDTEE
ncbi:hypothetical protein [Aerococcus kribbianus]|uniref:Membrane protein YkvI n=1 Tax=Aerococcus kribbianus TaxID=2999064 RepID=A0A9X3FNB0_9LACT|nr:MULTISPECIES: hypothetical protein [unclassified Aerococcus]MCZ0717414.1 hypothetical protein [Aerococcus sp. YH-aer221]MCZ0725702.1 hypothetical protein [Aerococcus sp. YH-aer222]